MIKLNREGNYKNWHYLCRRRVG